MNIVIVGSGGREHTLAWKVKQSKMVSKIFVLPGNGGISNIAECVAIQPHDISGIVNFCKNKKIDLVIIGPELPLSKDLAGILRSHKIAVVGPDQKAAMLESSKIWAKNFMFRHGIPTAKFNIVNSKEELLSVIEHYNYPVVIKMDTLQGGKGVFICENLKEVYNVAEDIYGNISGQKLVVEEFLNGVECSYMVFSDGFSYIPLVTSKDHKKIFEGEKGLNTGGMGAISPATIAKDVEAKALKEVIEPLLSGFREEGILYNGIIYAGLMCLPDGNIRVLEFNARFGDPETQVILTRMESDIMDILFPLGSTGLLPKNYKIKWKKESACVVVLAQKGYPEVYDKGEEIKGLDDIKLSEGEFIFHSGTIKEGNIYKVNGGRVLGVTALGKDIKEAKSKAYNLAKKCAWKNAYYRKDIGD